MLRTALALAGVAVLLTYGPASLLHVHAYAGHDHPEHRHGPASHTHVGEAEDLGPPGSGGTDSGAHLESCDAGAHAIAFAFTCVAPAPHHAIAFESAAPASVVSSIRSAGVSALADVRAHGPPGRTHTLLRAPPLMTPA